MKRYMLAKASFLSLFFVGGVCPFCLPKLVFIASLFGVSLAPSNSPFLKILFQITFLFVCILSFKNFRKHKVIAPFVLTLIGCLYLVAFSYLFPKIIILPLWTLYIACGVLLLAASIDYYLCKKHHVSCRECCSPSTHASRSENQSSCCS